jgi:hypothetical protein
LFGVDFIKPKRSLGLLSIGSSSVDFLTEGKIGIVHSVFERSFNVITSKQRMICFVRRDVFRGPINLVADLSQHLNMRDLTTKGAKVARVGDRIILDDGLVEFSMTDAEIWHSQNIFPPTQKILDNKKIWKNLGTTEIISKNYAKGNGLGNLIKFSDEIISDNGNIVDHTLNKISMTVLPSVCQLTRSLKNESLYQAGLAVKNLVGLGSGLTPSADDMIASLMATSVILTMIFKENLEFLNAFNNEIIGISDGKTTTLSLEFLRCAERGAVMEPIAEMIASILYSTPREVELRVKSVLEIGQTSGVDSILGVILAFRLFLDKFDNNLVY